MDEQGMPPVCPFLRSVSEETNRCPSRTGDQITISSRYVDNYCRTAQHAMCNLFLSADAEARATYLPAAARSGDTSPTEVGQIERTEVERKPARRTELAAEETAPREPVAPVSIATQRWGSLGWLRRSTPVDPPITSQSTPLPSLETTVEDPAAVEAAPDESEPAEAVEEGPSSGEEPEPIERDVAGAAPVREPVAPEPTTPENVSGPAPPILTEPVRDTVLPAGATLAVAGTGQPGSTVQVFDWLRPVATTTADETGRWGTALPLHEKGAHLISARLVDPQDGASPRSEPLTVTVGAGKEEPAQTENIRPRPRWVVRAILAAALIVALAALASFTVLRRHHAAAQPIVPSVRAPVSRPAAGTRWTFGPLSTPADQVILTFSGNTAPVDVQIQDGSAPPARIHVPVGGIALPLRAPSTATITVSSSGPVLPAREVVRGSSATISYGAAG